jgi:hypothetical protein
MTKMPEVKVQMKTMEGERGMIGKVTRETKVLTGNGSAGGDDIGSSLDDAPEDLPN